MVAQRAAQETWNRLTQSSIRRLDLKVSQRPSKLRPWRQDLEIGNDICKISRIGKILRLRTPKRRLKFLTHFMREGECISLIRCFPWAFDEAAEMPDQLTEQEWFGLGHKVLRLQEHVAGRWAAKEACFKAVHGLIPRTSFEITRRELDSKGHSAPEGWSPSRPRVYCWTIEHTSAAAEAALIEGRISISHDSGYAHAVAMFPGIDTIRGILEKQGQAVHRNRAPESSLSHDLADGTSARIDDQDQPSELRPKSLSMFNEFGYVRYKADAKRPLGMKGDT